MRLLSSSLALTIVFFVSCAPVVHEEKIPPTLVCTSTTTPQELEKRLTQESQRFIATMDVLTVSSAHDIDDLLKQIFKPYHEEISSLTPLKSASSFDEKNHKSTWKAITAEKQVYQITVYPMANFLEWYKEWYSKKLIEDRLWDLFSAPKALKCCVRFTFENEHYLAFVERSFNVLSFASIIADTKKTSSMYENAALERATMRVQRIGKQLARFHGVQRVGQKAPEFFVVSLRQYAENVKDFLVRHPELHISKAMFQKWFEDYMEGTKRPIFHLGYSTGIPTLETIGWDEENHTICFSNTEDGLYSFLGKKMGVVAFDNNLFVHRFAVLCLSYRENDVDVLWEAFDKAYMGPDKRLWFYAREIDFCDIAALLYDFANLASQEATMKCMSKDAYWDWLSCMQHNANRLRTKMNLPKKKLLIEMD